MKQQMETGIYSRETWTDLAIELEAETARLSDALKEAEANRERLAEVIRWALGETGEFPDWPETLTMTGNPKYWWRKELRKMFDAATQPAPAVEKKE